MKPSRVWILIVVAVLIGTSIYAKSVSKNALDKTQSLTYNLAVEPQYLDPAKSVGVAEFRVEYACFEGLAVFGKGDIPQPGAAEKWTVYTDCKTYTFTIRKNAKWSNVDHVTAADFE